MDHRLTRPDIGGPKSAAKISPATGRESRSGICIKIGGYVGVDVAN
jgi:hypothetical protein